MTLSLLLALAVLAPARVYVMAVSAPASVYAMSPSGAWYDTSHIPTTEIINGIGMVLMDPGRLSPSTSAMPTVTGME